MLTSATRRTRNIAAGIGLMTVLAMPGAALSQDELSGQDARELLLIESLQRAEEEHGPQGEELIAPLTTLSLFYEEDGNLGLADATIERLLAVIRANYGLHTLRQAAAIRMQMAHELERGNPTAAWEIERRLIELGLRNPDDIETARIFRDVGDRRLDILRRYEGGEMPVEIELGCYYNDWNDYRRAQRRGSQPLHSAPGQRRGNGCSAGSRGHAMRALAGEAHTFYGEAIKIFQRNEPEAKGELQDLYATVIRSSYENAAPNFGRSILRHLISTYPENSRERIETQVQLADWDLLYSVQTGKRVREAALAAYEEAYAQLRTNGVAQDSIDALFSPDLPILLPAFMPNPLVSQETPTSTGHIDIRFVVTVEGEGDDIEILDTTTADVPRAVRKDLADEIKRGRFRPILTDGRLARSDPFVVRYYLN